MSKIQCPEGHFYDSELFSQCPLCQKMEGIGNFTAPKSSGKSSEKKLAHKKNRNNQKSMETPVAEVPKPEKVTPPKRQKHVAPSNANIVTVAYYNVNGKAEEKQQENSGVLDEDGRLVLKGEHKSLEKKQENEGDYFTAEDFLKKNVPDPTEDVVEESAIDSEPEVVLNNSIESAEDLYQDQDDSEESTEETEPSEVEEEAPADAPEDTSDTADSEADAESEPEAEDEPEEQTAPEENEVPLEYQAIPVIPQASNGSKTVGFYSFENEPVVGWLVCVNGEIKGKSFRLKSGQNIISNSGISDVYLPAKQRSSEVLAVLIFEPQKQQYYIRSCSVKCKLNGNDLNGFKELTNYDKIEVGGYTLLFKGLCGSNFNWKSFE